LDQHAIVGGSAKMLVDDKDAGSIWAVARTVMGVGKSFPNILGAFQKLTSLGLIYSPIEDLPQ